MRNLFFALAVSVVIFLGNSCTTAEGNHAGTEYMPDMFHSIAYEANYYDYYYHNTWGTEQDYYKLAEARKPVAGTIARGYAGKLGADQFNGKASSVSVPMNGAVPYYYKDTEEERTRAMNEITKNPFPITTTGLEDAKFLYETYCGICHGKKADGNGYLVDETNPNAVYPAQPISFLSDDLIAASNGRYYHAIMYGKNVMGGYADKLSYEERWQVIHYIRSLQAKAKKLAYSETANTLNNIDIPGASMPKKAIKEVHEDSHDHDGHGHEDGHDHGDHKHEGDHGHDHGGHSHDDGHGHDDH